MPCHACQAKYIRISKCYRISDRISTISFCDSQSLTLQVASWDHTWDGHTTDDAIHKCAVPFEYWYLIRFPPKWQNKKTNAQTEKFIDSFILLRWWWLIWWQANPKTNIHANICNIERIMQTDKMAVSLWNALYFGHQTKSISKVSLPFHSIHRFNDTDQFYLIFILTNSNMFLICFGINRNENSVLLCVKEFARYH